jgi:hypothetical protein
MRREGLAQTEWGIDIGGRGALFRGAMKSLVWLAALASS